MSKVTVSIPEEMKNKDIVFRSTKPKKEISAFNVVKIFQCDHGVINVSDDYVKFHDFVMMLAEHGLDLSKLSCYLTAKTKKLEYFHFPYKTTSLLSFYWQVNDVMYECFISNEGNSTNITIQMPENYSLDVQNAILAGIHAELLRLSKFVKGEITIYYQLNGNWNKLGSKKKRNFDTIYIDNNVKDNLVKDIKKFYDSREMYEQYGVPWKRVYMFYGPPGTGKTSTILAIASEAGKNIYKCSMSGINGSYLEYLFKNAKNGIIVLEDVDALFTGREAKTGVDFSTLLNLLDGLNTQEGSIVIMTTNHFDKLDNALIRDGRVDMHLEFPNPTAKEIRQALMKLAPENAHEYDEFINTMPSNTNIPMVQAHIFRMKFAERTSILPAPKEF